MKAFSLCLSLSLPLVGLAAPQGDCFAGHLKEAIALNTARMEIYAGLTGGRSRALSQALIATERLSLWAAGPLDRAARPWQEKGIPILCLDFVSMDAAGPAPTEPLPRPADSFRALPVDEWSGELREVFATNGFEGLHRRALDRIEDLERPAEYHCMVRHVLESIARIAALAPQYEKAAARGGLPSPADLSERLVRLHLTSLALAADLDRRAAPFQAEGVPILCRDVPPIDTSPVLP